MKDPKLLIELQTRTYGKGPLEELTITIVSNTSDMVNLNYIHLVASSLDVVKV